MNQYQKTKLIGKSPPWRNARGGDLYCVWNLIGNTNAIQILRVTRQISSQFCGSHLPNFFRIHLVVLINRLKIGLFNIGKNV